MSSQDELHFSIISSQADTLAGEIARFSMPGQHSIRSLSLTDAQHMVWLPRDILIVDYRSFGGHADLVLPNDQPVLGLMPKDEVDSPSERALRCSEVIAWPGDMPELLAKLKRLSRMVAMEGWLERSLMTKLNMIGESKSFQQVISELHKYAKCNAPVLIMGETGTGKELVARAIHYFSIEECKPFVAVSCGALPDSLVENELFGHVKGAYTDAKESQCGMVEQAEGGTLFLDEIEALTAKGQVALLRFLQDQEYRPLGAQRSKKASLRLVIASNEPLEKLVEQGVFRRDLFYRLNVLVLQLPPLRERGSDVILLAEHFIDKYREIYQQYDKYLDASTLEWLTRHDWPGNVRELENLILREFLLSDTACISIDPPRFVNNGERRANIFDRRYAHLFRQDLQNAKATVVSEFERCYLDHVLHNADGNISEAARQAGKERRTFAKLLAKYGLNRTQFTRN